MQAQRVRHSAARVATGFAITGLLAGTGSIASAQSVGISAVPSVQRIEWSDKLAFSDDYMYGGRLSLLFGKYVELQPFYFTRDNYDIDSNRAPSLFGPESEGKGIDLRHYGVGIQFNLGDGPITPFARGGAGVLRLKPDSAARQDRITVSAGGGIRFGISGLNAEIFAEQMSFRMNPLSIFGADTAGAETPTLRNLVYGAALTVPLSTMRETDYTDGLRGSTAPIEPFVGVLRYASENGLPNQELAGVRAGIDFSPVFGVRGFYWRGLNDDRDGTVPVTGYGGETQFNLNTGPGVSPYLIVGAGRIDYGNDFADSLGAGRADKTAFILGGGASLRLTDRIRLNGAVRDYIMTVDDNLDNVASTSDITHNTMLTAGLTISIGGRSGQTESDRVRERDRELRDVRARLAERERELERRERGEPDMMSERERLMERERMLDERMRRMNREGVVVERDTIMMRRQMGGAQGQQWVTVPVPAYGEIILRYGFPPAGVTVDSTMIRRDTVRMMQGTPNDLARRLDEIERRINARLDAMQGQQPQRRDPTPQVVTRPMDMVEVDRENVRARTPVFQRLGRTGVSDLRPYAGFGFGDNTQFVVGARADLGPLSPNSGFHFVPELAVGLGGDLSVLALANVRYAFGSVGGQRTVRPYATFGGGIFSPSVLGINTAVGSAIAIGAGETPLLLNVELQGINLFDHTRLLFGLTRVF